MIVYAQGLHLDDAAKRRRILEIFGAASAHSFVVPAQVLGELFNVLTRKARYNPAAGAQVVATWQDMMSVIPTTQTVLSRGVDIAVDHGLAIWDAIILAAAAEAGCRVLLSEDMHEGFTWGSVTIVNPFAPSPHRLLNDLRA